MKFLSRLLLLGICFELLVAPIKPELAVVTVLRANADASTCGAGTSWSDAANRCLVNASTAQTQRDLEACAKLSTPEEQKACYEKNANKGAGGEGLTSGDIQAMYKGNSFGLNVAKTAVYALPLMLFGYMMVKKKMFGKNKCLPPSTIAMMVASVTMLGGEVYGFIKHKSNLKKLDEAREKLFTPKTTDNLDQKKVDATQMQSEAFQLLSDEQKSIEDLAKTKKIFYGVAASAFAAAAGIAAYELISLKLAKSSLLKIAAKESVTLSAQNPPNQRGAQIAGYTVTLGTKEATKFAKLAKEVKDLNANTNVTTDDKIVPLEVKGVADTLNQLITLGTPETSPAASKYANLLAKFECWERDTAMTSQNKHMDNTIKELNEKNKDPMNINDSLDKNKIKMPTNSPRQEPYNNSNGQESAFNYHLPNRKELMNQIQMIRNSSSVDEILALSNDFEEMVKGQSYSSLDSQTEAGFFNKSTEDQIFVRTFAGITADQLAEKYSLNKNDNTPSVGLETIIAKLQSEIGISQAHAKAGMLLAILPTAGMLLMSSNIFKGGKNKGKNGSSSGNSDASGSNSTTDSASGNKENFLKEEEKTDGKFQKFLQTPTFRIAFGGVLGVLTGFMTKEMADQQKIAKARKETLLKLKGDFENTQGMKICTPAERNDQSQPGCYCYTAEGSRNPARGNSAVCQNMWNSIALNNNSYLASGGSGPKVCITQSNQIDQSCSCRTSNTCLKASGFNISGINLSTLSTLGSGLNPINTVASGNGAELNADGLLNNAFKFREATNKILKDKDMKNENAIVTAAEKNLGNFIGANTGTIGSPSAGRAMPTSLANFDAKAALEDLKEEVESTNSVASTPGPGVGFDTGSSEPTLEFGLTEEEAAVQEQQVAEVLQQDMDLGTNDISGSSTNLFEVLSHRYQRSGMRRLFDTEGKTEADKPAETDINK
ncbi:MAG: hypothetical protein ACOVP4_10215 [Bacteriovoracaceae bacterium]